MTSLQGTCTYFDQGGPQNTTQTLAIAQERARQLGTKDILVATTSGETGALAAESMPDLHVVAVTHSTGFAAPNQQQLEDRHRDRILAAGAEILTCQHAFGGVGRAVRRKLGTYQIDEIIAFTLRLFGDGLKVACEITLMAADAGLVRAGDQVIAVGGSTQGADTAAVIRAANAQDLFDLRVLEILCKPRGWSSP
ncbi:MAG: pyruvate kinase alpha/beta domain-containing protein [Anaerolineae bacterium]